MVTKSFSIAALMGCLVLGAAPSFASTVDIGTLYAGDSASPDGGKVNAPNTIHFAVASREYLSLSATIAGDAQLAPTYLVLTDLTGVDAGQTWAALFVKSGFWNAALGVTGDGLEIQAGDYSFTIVPTGIANTSVGYSLALAVSPGVPELSSWAMMLAGFSALGFVGYRRKVSATAFA